MRRIDVALERLKVIALALNKRQAGLVVSQNAKPVRSMF
jgi:hypothetical protein